MTQVLATGLKSVFDFKRPRSALAATGFYLFHLVFGSMVSAVMSMAIYKEAYAFLNRGPGMDGFVMFLLFAIISLFYCMSLHYFILCSKRKNHKWTGMMTTFVLSWFGIIFLGLIPASIEIGRTYENLGESS